MNVQKFKAYWEKIGRPARQFKSSSQPWRDVPYDNFDWFENDDYRIKDNPHWELMQKWIESDFTLPIEFSNAVLKKWTLCKNPSWVDVYEYREAKQGENMTNDEILNGDGLNDPQPEPIKNNGPAIWSMVIKDMIERDIEGQKRYGTRLQPNNGRDPLIDAYQEALDLACYLRQAIYERKFV